MVAPALPGLVVVMGSKLIGIDPFDPASWSGSSRLFLLALQERGLLHRAFGVEVSPAEKARLLLRNFSPRLWTWKQKFLLDRGYYDSLTARIAQAMNAGDMGHPFLQIGALYDVPSCLEGGRPCFSYHDGNVVQMTRSPYFKSRVSNRRIDRAIEYERQVYSKLTRIFTMSEYLRRSFIDDFGVPEEKVVKIGAGINFERMPRPHERDWSVGRLLFVGSSFGRKGGLQLLAAFARVRERFPDAELHVVGPARPASPAASAPGVHWHGHLSKGVPAEAARLAGLFETSTLFVLPSLYEPFGIAAVEAMAFGLPCVLSDGWAFPEMVVPGIHGALVPPEDSDTLGECIIDLLRDPDRLAAMGAAAHARAVDEFTWARTAERLGGALAAAAA